VLLLEQKQTDQLEGLSGFTDNYLRVNLPDASHDMINTLQEIRIEGFDVTGDLIGKFVPCHV